jgi:hypothetical protein
MFSNPTRLAHALLEEDTAVQTRSWPRLYTETLKSIRNEGRPGVTGQRGPKLIHTLLVRAQAATGSCRSPYANQRAPRDRRAHKEAVSQREEVTGEGASTGDVYLRTRRLC